jgi:hypothetical protein
MSPILTKVAQCAVEIECDIEFFPVYIDVSRLRGITPDVRERFIGRFIGE